MGSEARDRGDRPVSPGRNQPPGELPRDSTPLPGVERDVSIKGNDPSKDTLFKVLGNRRRRHILHYLEWCDRPVRLDELAERIAAWESDTSIESVGSQERKRVYTALQQFHLPKLAEASLVEYDERAGIIERTPIADDLEVYLDLVPENDIPWSYCYLGTALIGIVLTGLSAIEFALFALLPPAVWATGVLFVVLGSATAHAYSDRRHRLGASVHPPDADRD